MEKFNYVFFTHPLRSMTKFLHIRCVIFTYPNGFEYVIFTYPKILTSFDCVIFTHSKLLFTTYSQPVNNFSVYIQIFFAKIKKGKKSKNNSMISPFGHSL